MSIRYYEGLHEKIVKPANKYSEQKPLLNESIKEFNGSPSVLPTWYDSEHEKRRVTQILQQWKSARYKVKKIIYLQPRTLFLARVLVTRDRESSQ